MVRFLREARRFYFQSFNVYHLIDANTANQFGDKFRRRRAAFC